MSSSSSCPGARPAGRQQRHSNSLWQGGHSVFSLFSISVDEIALHLSSPTPRPPPGRQGTCHDPPFSAACPLSGRKAWHGLHRHMAGGLGQSRRCLQPQTHCSNPSVHPRGAAVSTAKQTALTREGTSKSRSLPYLLCKNPSPGGSGVCFRTGKPAAFVG